MSIPSGDINAISDDLCFGSFPSYGATDRYPESDWPADPTGKRKSDSLYALELTPLLAPHSAPPTPPEFSAAGQSKKARLHSPSAEDCIARLLNIEQHSLAGNTMLLHTPCEYQNLSYMSPMAAISASAEAKKLAHDELIGTGTLTKKQERMIKNRAAAVLSRQRKKEHMQNLEQHIEGLRSENKSLKSKITELESKLKKTEKERDSAVAEFGDWLRHSTSWGASEADAVKEEYGAGALKAKTAGVVLMLLFFSFAIFPNTLMYISDSSKAVSRRILEHKEPGVSGSSALRIKGSTESNSGNNTTVAPKPRQLKSSMHDLHRWLQSNGMLDKDSAMTETRRDLAVPPERGLILLPESAQFQTIPESSPRAKKRDMCGPRLSLLSPLERHGKYLRIDVQVLGSQHVK